jgi:hypothetical protein
MIEAANTFENGPYLLYTTADAAGFVESVGRKNVKLQYDVYHMQRMEENLVATMRKHIGRIAHVQSRSSATTATWAWSTAPRPRGRKKASRGSRRICAAAMSASKT